MNIGSAISAGFTIAQILGFLTNNFPNLGKKVKEAQKLGYDVKQIVKTFSDMTPDQLEKYDKSSAMKSDNPWINSIDTQREGSAEVKGKEYLKKGAKLAGAVAIPLAAYGLQRYMNKAIMSDEITQGQLELPSPEENLQLEFNQQQPQTNITPPQTPPIQPPQPTPPPQPLTPSSNMGQQLAQQAQAPVMQAMQPSSPNQIVGAAQALPSQNEMMPEEQMQVPKQMPTQQEAPLPIFEQLLQGIDTEKLTPPQQQQLKFLSMISDQLQSKGKTLNDPEFQTLAKKIKAVVAGKPGMVLEENARFQAGQQEKQANVKPLDIEKKQEPISSIDTQQIVKPASISKGESVVTEDGNLAEVKGISGNNFLIAENGKVRQVPMDSLRSQPEAIKKSKIIFDPSKVPESERSAALAISLPMPDKSSIINMFHDGSFYLYRRKDGKPIEESIIKRVIEGQDIPMTSGESFMGSWNNDKGDSRGSASHKELTAMAQDVSKPDDPTKPLIFEKITSNFVHGYYKEFQQLLKEATKHHNAKPKKPKK